MGLTPENWAYVPLTIPRIFVGEERRGIFGSFKEPKPACVC